MKKLWASGARLLRTPCGIAYARGDIGRAKTSPTLRLLLAHGVGHHKELWSPVVLEIASLLDAANCSAQWLAVDFSGHGASRAQPDGAKWDLDHAAEVGSVLDHASSEKPDSGDGLPLVGVGSSMGGAVLVCRELRRPGFDHVIAIEPPLFTRAARALALGVSALRVNWLAKRVAKRRGSWPSREAARAHVAARSGEHWVAAALDAFAAHGVVPPATGAGVTAAAGDGPVTLACAPRIEARSMLWPGATSLPELAAAYDGGSSFTLLACAASHFSPIGVPGSGVPYYRHAIAPSLPGREAAGRAAAFRVLGDGATHAVGQEQPNLLARAIVEDLRERGLV